MRMASNTSLCDGVNYTVVPGKQKGSKIVIHEDYGYIVEKSQVRDGRTKRYLKCKFSGCAGRAVIEGKVLTVRNTPSRIHTCKLDNNVDRGLWRSREVFRKMKDLAETENMSIRAIYNKCLTNEEESVKARLTFDRVRKPLNEARLASIPSFPDTIPAFLNNMERGVYPPRYKELFLGHATIQQSGN